MDEKSQGGFQYNPNDDEGVGSAEQEEKSNPIDKDRIVSWTGSEFIANHKSANWFMAFFSILALVVGLIFIFTRDYISTISVAVAGMLFAILANHKPRQLAYQIDNSGINIGSKFYPFDLFKSFTLSQEGAIDYISLLPMRRFMPDVSIYFPPEQAEEVVSILSDHLPHNEDGERQIDKLAKRFRF